MDIKALKKFITIAQYNHLSIAAKQLNQTPAALSKVIKRLEQQLSVTLFDRIGRNIKLNRNGRKLLQYAIGLVHETEQMISEFVGDKGLQNVNIAGPSILLQYWLPKLIESIEKNSYRWQINAVWEGDALNQLLSGGADMALVTGFALQNDHHQSFKTIQLSHIKFCIIAADNHPIMHDCQQYNQIDAQALLSHAFVSPSVSPFCGMDRGEQSDGWQHLAIKRKLHYRCNDISVLLKLVSEGMALAYVPEFMIKNKAFNKINVLDFQDKIHETVQLVYRPSMACGWLNCLVDQCAAIVDVE